MADEPETKVRGALIPFATAEERSEAFTALSAQIEEQMGSIDDDSGSVVGLFVIPRRSTPAAANELVDRLKGLGHGSAKVSEQPW